MKKIIFIFSLFLMASTAAFADQNHELPVVKFSPEFDQLKSLVGNWKGTTTGMDGKPEKVKAEYKLTSGGSALVETLFKGTPHEMVSVYHDTNGRLSMTHYCMIGNHPELELKSKTDNTYVFDLSKKSGISKKENHMHGLTVETPDQNTLTQTWQCWKDGKPNGPGLVISLKRSNF